MFRSVRPVGEPVLRKPDAQDAANLFAPLKTAFYGSGTMALAAAVGAATARCGSSRPEIILPAYGCPSLVSAVLNNGAIPRLADLSHEGLKLDIHSVIGLINEHTAAIIVVDLFGLPDDIQLFRDLATERKLVLIHDCAQTTFDRNRISSVAHELVILSFGRGKPVSVLTGGAVLHQPAEDYRLRPPAEQEQGLLNCIKHSVKIAAYNQLIRDSSYWLSKLLPGVGQTEYCRLEKLLPMALFAQRLLKANYLKAIERHLPVQRYYQRALRELAPAGWKDLAVTGQQREPQHLLRYPVLAPSLKIRDQLLSVPGCTDLGITGLYLSTLPEIRHMPRESLVETDHPNAEDVASRLLTLPLHSGISEKLASAVILSISAC